MRKSLLVSLLLFVSYSSYSQEKKEPIEITDMLKIKTVSNIQVDPTGSKAIYAVQRIEAEKDKPLEYKYQSQLWMMDVTDPENPWPITFRESAGQPSWSPDGKKIAFTRAVAGKSQIFVLSLKGGEPQQLTHFKYGAGTPKWSPDGKQILFTASISLQELVNDSILNPTRRLPSWPIEVPGVEPETFFAKTKASPDPDGNMKEVRAYLNKNEEDRKAKVFTKLNHLDEMDASSSMRFSELFIIDVNNPKNVKALTNGFYSSGSASFLPDGKKIIYTIPSDTTIHPDRALGGQIVMMNADGTEKKSLLKEAGYSFGAPVISPSGKWMVYSKSKTEYVGVPSMFVYNLTDYKTVKEIPYDRNKGNIRWSDDEKSIYFTAQSNGSILLCKADVATNQIDVLTNNGEGINSYDLAGKKLFYAKTNIYNPSELYVADENGKNEKQLSVFNSGWLASKAISVPEKYHFKNDKGLTIEYWVMKPINFEQGKKYPLILEIHGGPSAMWGPGEASMWHEYQYFASKGYGVVYSNPRGSGGYGEKFLRGNVNDWSKGPASDVLKSTDLASQADWVDKKNLFITGGSYAGYLISWIIAHDHRFKAACAQRGVYDLNTFLGEGNAWRLVSNYFGGYPWEQDAKKIIDRENPMNYASNIKTPLIIFHGENDRRTGFIQSEMLYKTLKILERPVEYVRHPGATHEITRSGNNRQRIDQMLRTWEFFERWKK